jgi:hypothetical protein
MFAHCLELNIGVSSYNLEHNKYRKEISNNLADLVYGHISAVLNGSVNEETKKYEKISLLGEPMIDYLNLLDQAIVGEKPLICWEPKIIDPSNIREGAWLPFPVILYFFEIGNYVLDHTKDYQ